MSFARTYRPLFSVAAEDGASHARLAALAFVPTRACERKLADHQLLFRPREGGLQILYQTNPEAADPLLGRIEARTRFSFAMVAQGNLLERYHPDLTAATGPQLLLDNLTPGGNIQTKNTLSVGTTVQDTDGVKIHPPVFVVSLDLDVPAPPTAVRIHDKFDADTVLREVPIAAAEGSAPALTRIDLSDLPSGPYLLDTDAPASVARTIYVDRELAARPVLGVVDLYRETPQDDDFPNEQVSYFIRFQPR
jgi:hypothetical protein